jgi:GxxExxY protein
MDMRVDQFHSRHVPEGEEHDELTEQVIGAAIEVHRELGPGLTEILYEAALCHEFDLRGIPYARQMEIDVVYKGKKIGKTRIDLLVADRLILELKACEHLNDVHRAQCITYLGITGKTLALLINFNVKLLKDGIKRIAKSK